MNNLLEKITEQFSSLAFVEGIVLGGSRATGTASARSDIDIGIYYNGQQIDYAQLNQIARELDDEHREQLICKEREWGTWVNCGGWLTVDGQPVDLILRNTDRVEECIRQTGQGNISMHYQTGHPHAYLNVMYRGELACAKLLYANERIHLLKKRAEAFPKQMQSALMEFFLFEAQFSCTLAKKYQNEQDLYYVAGHIFRSVSALNQVIFALNKMYCINEKKAILRIDGMERTPVDYSERVNCILELERGKIAEHLSMLEQLCEEVKSLVQVDL